MDAELVEAVILLIFSSRFDRLNDQKALLRQPLFLLFTVALLKLFATSARTGLISSYFLFNSYRFDLTA